MNIIDTLFSTHLLSLITFLPLVTGIFLLLLHRLPSMAWRIYALISTTLTFLLSIVLFFRFDPALVDYQFIEHVTWLPALGVNYFVGIDGISLLLLILTTFIMPIVVIASWNNVPKSPKSFIFFMLFIHTTDHIHINIGNGVFYRIDWVI